eukprot:COSAG06_NODE_3268_length_5589_cov_69.631857_5_plen_712_part_01
MPALEQLRMSELLDRARALGAPQDFLDELMDTAEPRQALLEMLLQRTKEKEAGELGSLVASLREDAAALATAARVPKKPEERHVRPLQTLSTMIQLSTASADAALELASMHVPEVAASMIQDAFEADADAVNAVVLPPAMLLLATLAAHQDCHAWFTGSGAVAAVVGALNLEQTEDDADAEAELLPLACSALANLAAPPSGNEPGRGGLSEGSTAVAKEILAAGGLVPLIELVGQGARGGGSGSRSEGAAASHAHERALRSQQWAAAALCNLSQHGERAREVLIRHGVLEAAVAGLRRLMAETAAAAPAEEEGEQKGAGLALAAAPPLVPLQPPASPGSVIQLLLGCLANLAPYMPEELLDAGAIEVALAVLAEAPLIITITQQQPRDADGGSGGGSHQHHPLHDAATALIRNTAEAAASLLISEGQGDDDECYPDLSSGGGSGEGGGSSGHHALTQFGALLELTTTPPTPSESTSRVVALAAAAGAGGGGVAVCRSEMHPQLASLPAWLTAVAKARPESVAVRELLAQLDVINYGAVTEECSALLLELEREAEAKEQERVMRLHALTEEGKREAERRRREEEAAAAAEVERIEAAEAAAEAEAAAAAVATAAEEEQRLRQDAAAAKASRIQLEREARERAAEAEAEAEAARQAAAAEAEAARVARLEEDKAARRAERKAARALTQQKQAEDEAEAARQKQAAAEEAPYGGR